MRVALFAAFPHELRQTLRNVEVKTRIKGRLFHLHLARCASHEVIAVQTGIGTGNAESAFTYVLEEHYPDVIVSIGFGGALYEGVEIGELVWPSKVLLFREGIADTLDVSDAGKMFDKSRMREGTVVTIEKWIEKSEIRKALDPQTLCPVSDMETFPLARLSLQKGLPFFAVRSITDRADEEIPPDLLGVSDKSGNYRLTRALGLLLSKPALIPQSVKLGRYSALASKNLWHAVESLLKALR